jgi:PilZ domain-containing protein
MDEKRRHQRKEVIWHLVSGDRTYSLGVISFNNLVRTDYLAKIVNRSIIGICIETDQPIQLGIVWFKERVHEQKCGVVMWCNQIGSRYRCGIQFVSLTGVEEEYLQHQIEQVKPSKPVRDPDRIITRLNECIPRY